MKRIKRQKSIALILSIVMLLSMFSPFGSVFAEEFGTDQAPDTVEADSGNETSELGGNENRSWIVHFNPGNYSDYDENSNGKMDDQIVEDTGNEELSVKLSKNEFTREGYTFAGWSNTPDGKDVEDNPETEDVNETVRAFVVTLDDEQEMINWSFTRDTNGDGTDESFDISYAFNEGLELTLYAQWKQENSSSSLGQSIQNLLGSIFNSNSETDSEGEQVETETSSKESDKNTISKNQTQSTEETSAISVDNKSTQTVENGSVTDGIQAEKFDDEVKTDENGVVIDDNQNIFQSIASSVHSLFTASGEKDSELVSYSDEDDNYTADGTTIEKLESFWITNNAGYDPLEITTSSTAKLSMTYRVEYAISGQYDFAAGEVELRVPAVVFKDRSGKDEGTLALAVPEDPDKGAEFNYRRVGDEYILTNTRRMSGASSGYFEFTFKDLDPVELVSGQEWGPFNVQLSVITNSGDTLTKTSNSLTAIVNTNETISSAYKRGDLYDSFPSSWSKAVTLPDGFNKDDYIYVDWYTYCYITGNQYFTMGISDDISNSGVDGAVLLGGTLTDQAGNSVYAKDNLFTGWKGSGNNFYHHLYVAYPKSKFPATVTNTVNYTLTTLDTEISTTKSATASLFYEPKPFSVPSGHFQAHKWGVSKNGQFKSNTSYYDQSNNLGIGNYPYALNELSQGSSTKLTYETVSEGFPFPCTYEGDGSEDSLNDISNYGKKSVHFSQEDSRLWFDFDYDNQLTGADYRVTGVEFLTPVMYTYSKDNAGNWGYYTSSSVEAPEIHIYGKSDTGNWIEYGTVTWSTDSSRTITITPMNGASVSEKHLLFPEGVTSWKSEFDTAAAGVKICICPTVELFSTENFRNVVAELMANSDSAYTEVRNSMSMTVTQDDATLFYADDRSGYDKLTAATQAFWMRKNGSVIKNDTTNKVASLKYEATVFEQSSLTEKSDYQAAVESGVINQDHGGTFYDLLPAQVAPDLSTVTVSGGNVTNVQLHENWRGSGRSLLEVSFTRDPKTTYIYSSSGGRGNSYGDYFTLSFNAAYTWIDMFDRGCTVTNVIAYGSDEEWLGNIAGLTGSPDDPLKGDNAYTTQAVKDAAQYLTDLKAEHDNPSFVYSSNVLPVNVETAALNSLQKYVSVLNNGIYVTGSASELSVPEGGAYTYMLRMTNDSATKSKNLILYDDLEAFVPGEEYADDCGKAQWQGYFRGLDLSQIEAMGVAPVVYYATQSVGLENYRDDGSTVDLPDLSDTTIWTTTCPADPSTVKAIAIDCSKDTDGNEFVLQENQSIQALVLMRAPTGDSATQAINDNAYAFNNVYVSSVKTIDGQNATSYIHHDYTRLLLAPYSITVNKTWNDDSNRDGIRPGSVTVQLTRTGSDGVTENVGDPVELNEGNKWSYQFEHLVWGDPNGIAYQYSVTELNTPEGYTPSVFFDGFEEIRLTNTHKIAVLPYQNAQKTWEDEGNEDQRPSSITLTLYKNGSSYKRVSLSPSADGTWIWNFGELPKFEDGQEINWTISENYVPGYVFESERTETSWNLNNRYDPYGDITLTKTLVDATSVSEQNLFTFTFTLMDKNGEYDGNTYEWESNKGNTGTITNGDSITISRDETITIKKIPSESTYEFVEERVNGFTLSSSKNLKGTVKAGQSSEVTCTNTYNATGTVQIVANKVLEGRTLKNAQFRFNLMNSDGTIIRSATNDADGKVAFGAITYGLADVGQTYHYTIKEVDSEKPGYTYDHNELGVSVTITDNGDGTLNTDMVFDNQINTFTNKYHAEGSFNLTAHKYVIGCEAYGGMSAFTGVFGFEILDESGSSIQNEAVNDSDGEISFQTMNFDENDVGEKTFKVREITPDRSPSRFEGYNDLDIIDYDSHTATITIKIVDNGDGTLTCVLKSMESDDERDNSESLVFKNKLKDGDLIITKEVNDSSVEDFEFEVTLTPPDGVEIKDGVYDYDVYEGVISPPRICAENPCSETGVIIHNPESDKIFFEKILDWVVDLFTPTTVYAAEIPVYDPKETDSTDISSGNWGDCSWRITSDGVLTIGAGKGADTGSTSNVPWYSKRNSIKQVRAEQGVILPSNSSHLFYNCTKLADIDLSGFNTTNVTNMSYMFYYCYGLTSLDLSSFNTANVTNMSSMFYYCFDLSSLNLSPLDTGNVTNMSSMFYNCSGLTSLNLSPLDTGNVTNMSSMFKYCSGLTSLNLSPLDTGNVTNMSEMFYGCSKLTSLDLSPLDTGNVTNMSSMFRSCSGLILLDLSSLNTGNVTNMSSMFRDCSKLILLDLSSLDTGNVRNMSSMFYNCSGLTSLNLSPLDTGNVTNMSSMFSSCSGLTSLNLSPLDTGNVTNMSYMFEGCSKLTSLDVSNFDTANVLYMDHMFYSCWRLTSLNLSSLDTGNVRNMSYMFYYCSGLTSLDLSSLDTGNVTNMSSMFSSCYGLTSLNLSPLDTGNVTNMSYMFFDCSGLTSLDLSSLDTGSVTNMSCMFYGCSGLTSLDLSSLDTGNVTNMSSMFEGCSKLTSLDVSNFDTVKVAYMYSMFKNCSKLTKIKIGSNYYNSSINYTVNQYLPGLMGWKWTSEDGNFGPYTPSDLQKEFSSSAERAAELSGWWEVDIPDYKITIKDGKFTVKVPAHSHVIISGIPAGTTYTVEELDKDGWTLVEHQSSGSNIIRPSTNSGENISEWDSSLSIEYFYNISNTTKYTSIPVSAEKLLNGDLPTTSFEFNLSDVTDSENPKSLGSVHSSGVYADHPGMIDLYGFSSSSFETGSYRLQLTEVIPEDDDTYIYDDHAYFITFDVIEEDGTKYFTNIGTEGSMTFRNYTKDYNSDNDNSDSLFSIELVKKVTDASGTDISDSKANQPFTFDLTLTDKTGTPLNGLYGGRLNVVDGKASVQVYPGEGNKVTLTDIPEGTIYSVSEADIPAGYSWDENVNIEKVYEEPIITGDTLGDLCINGVRFMDEGDPANCWYYQWYFKYGDSFMEQFDQILIKNLNQLYPGASGEELTEEQQTTVIKATAIEMWKYYEGSNALKSVNCTITNVYDPVGYAQIDAAKKFNGNLSTGIFTFGLYDSDGNLVSTAANNSDGSIYFDELTYKQAGTYNYTIREIEGTDSMITYDTTAIPVSVVVTDNGDGTLNTEVQSDQERVFTNTVKTGSLTVTKAVRNGTENALKNDFTFALTLKDANGNDLTNKYSYTVGEDSGTIGSGDTFRLKDGESLEITGLPAGTRYEITEEGSKGFTLIEESSMNGQIEADQTSAVNVTNLYDADNDPDKTLNLGDVLKLLVGGTIEDYTFNFEVRDENGSVVSTGQSDDRGSVTFSPVSYTLEDVGKTYQYTVAEVNDGQSGIKYDGNVRTVSITVNDDGHGLIYSTAQWEDNPVFTNSVSYGDLPAAGHTSWFNIVLSLMLIGFLLEVAYSLSKRKMK